LVLQAVGVVFHEAAVDVVSATTQLNADELAARPWLSVRVTVGVKVPAVEGVPVMLPVALSITRPVGRPLAVHVAVTLAESKEPVGVKETAEPSVVDWAEGVVTEMESSL